MSEPSIFSKVLANLSRSANQPGAGNSVGPPTKEQAMLAKAKEIGERLDRLQTKLDAHAAKKAKPEDEATQDEDGEDEASLPIRERFNRQVKRNAAK